MTTYRAGVIGHTGRGNYGHSLDSVYLGMEEIDLIAVADADPEGLAAAGERLSVDPANCYQDYRHDAGSRSSSTSSASPPAGWIRNTTWSSPLPSPAYAASSAKNPSRQHWRKPTP